MLYRQVCSQNYFVATRGFVSPNSFFWQVCLAKLPCYNARGCRAEFCFIKPTAKLVFFADSKTLFSGVYSGGLPAIRRIISLLLLLVAQRVESASLGGDITVNTNLTQDGSPYVITQDLVAANNYSRGSTGRRIAFSRRRRFSR